MIPFQYEFNGMSPSDWTEDYLKEELLPLAAWAPKDSNMKLRAEKYQGGFEGKLILYSGSGAFVVEEKAPDLTVLVKGLKKKMKTKLHKWRDTATKVSHKSYRHAS